MGIAIADSYAETNQSSGVDLFTGSITRCGQSFTPSFSGVIDSAQFYLKKTGSPSGEVVSRLYAMSTALGGDNDIPAINFPVISSSKVPTSSITTSYQLISFDFTANGQIPIIKGFNYVVSLEYALGDASNLITVGTDNTAPTHTGNQVTFTASWAASTSDVCFYVYVDQLTNYSGSRGTKKIVRVGDGMGRSG
jgi:hypothetical protein